MSALITATLPAAAAPGSVTSATAAVRSPAQAHPRVQVSFDGGRTWRDATLTGRAGHYTATYTAPADHDITLRVTAADAVGGRITETITRAYRTTGGPSPAG